MSIQRTVDPVCGMEVDRLDPPTQTNYKGTAYYFCSPECRDRFLQNPEQYIKAASQAPA